MKTIWVRHGESEYDAQDLVTGWHDPVLTQTGMEQSLAAAGQLVQRYTLVDSIHTSDLRRAAQTASIILQNSPWFIELEIDNRLRDRDRGEWSGQPSSRTSRETWSSAAPGGESLSDTASRVADYLDDVPQSTLPILFVCHLDTIRAASVVFGINTPDTVMDWKIEMGEFVEWEF